MMPVRLLNTSASIAEELSEIGVRGLLVEGLVSTAWGIVPGLALLLVAFIVGRSRERAHIRSIGRREVELADISALTVGVGLLGAGLLGAGPVSASKTCMVSGSVVVAGDLFKAWRARWRGLIGGAIPHYETMMMRARREAVLRMKADARSIGLSTIVGVRLETSAIGENGAAVEVFAYGTALA